MTPVNFSPVEIGLGFGFFGSLPPHLPPHLPPPLPPPLPVIPMNMSRGEPQSSSVDTERSAGVGSHEGSTTVRPQAWGIMLLLSLTLKATVWPTARLVFVAMSLWTYVSLPK